MKNKGSQIDLKIEVQMCYNENHKEGKFKLGKRDNKNKEEENKNYEIKILSNPLKNI